MNALFFVFLICNKSH